MPSAYDRHRGSRHERGYDNKWAKAAKAFLKAHPYCAICGAIATLVDHIIPHNGDMRLFWRRTNWQSLCHPCHNAKTASDKTGKPMKGCDAQGWPIDGGHHWNE